MGHWEHSGTAVACTITRPPSYTVRICLETSFKEPRRNVDNPKTERLVKISLGSIAGSDELSYKFNEVSLTTSFK